MFETHREKMFETYGRSRAWLIEHNASLVAVEQYVTGIVCDILTENYESFKADYDEASFLYPF